MTQPQYCTLRTPILKQKVRPVQTADILAWQQATQVKRWQKGDQRMRADCRALVRNPDMNFSLALVLHVFDGGES